MAQEEHIKHLELIQKIISRLNSNSFQIKNWMIVLVSALVSFYAADKGNNAFILMAVFVTVIFWIIDTYYLIQERKFRMLYEDVVNQNPNIKPFSMQVQRYHVCWWEVFLSSSLTFLYVMIIVVLSVVYCFSLIYVDCNVIS